MTITCPRILFIITALILLLFTGCHRGAPPDKAEDSPASAKTAVEENRPDETGQPLSRTDSPEKHLLRGRIFASKGEYKKALAEYSAVTEKDGELYYKALCAGGELQMSEGNVKAAEILYHRAVELFPSLSDAHLGMAEVFLETGQPQAALGEISVAEKSSSGREYPEVLKARCQLRLQHFDEAEKILKQTIKRYPDSIQSYLILAGILADRDEIPASQVLLSRALTLSPDKDARKEILQLQARNYSRLGDEKKFQEVLKTLSGEHPQPWFSHQVRGEVLFAEKKWQDAVREFEAALSLSPGNLDLHLNLGHLYYRMRERDLARKHYGKVLETEPNHLESILVIVDIDTRERLFEDARKGIRRAEELGAEIPLIVAKANLAMEERDFPVAERLFKKVLETEPLHENALWGMGNIALLKGKYLEAEEYFKKELETDPENFEVWLGLSESLTARGQEKAGKDTAARAVKEIENTLAGMPRHDDAWGALGRLKAINGEYEAAEKTLRKAIELRRNFFGPRVDLANIMLKDGRGNRGEELMEQLLIECPKEVEGRHILAEYYLGQGRYEEAVTQAKAACMSLPGNLIGENLATRAMKAPGKE